MSLETAAIAAYRGDWTEQARAELVRLLGDPDGTVSALDAADTPVPAASPGGTFVAGGRVQVTIRTPQRPLVTGKVT